MRTCNRANRRESTIELLSAPAAGGQYGTLRMEWGRESSSAGCIRVLSTSTVYCALILNKTKLLTYSSTLVP